MIVSWLWSCVAFVSAGPRSYLDVVMTVKNNSCRHAVIWSHSSECGTHTVNTDLALWWHTCKVFAFASSDVFLTNLGQARAQEFMAAVSRLLFGPRTDSEQDAGLFTGSMFQNINPKVVTGLTVLLKLCSSACRCLGFGFNQCPLSNLTCCNNDDVKYQIRRTEHSDSAQLLVRSRAPSHSFLPASLPSCHRRNTAEEEQTQEAVTEL